MKGDNPAPGDLLVLTAQLSYALYLTLYKDFIRRYSLVTLMKWMFLFAAIALTPIAAKTFITAPWAEIGLVVVGRELKVGCEGRPDEGLSERSRYDRVTRHLQDLSRE